MDARELQLLHSTQTAHSATLAALKTVEEPDRVILADLRPSVSGSQFLSIVVFHAFCLGMFGRCRESPARNYVLDSIFLFLGDLVYEVAGVDVAEEFERGRCTQVRRYMARIEDLRGENQQLQMGMVISSLISTFESEVFNRQVPRLGAVSRELLAAQVVFAEGEPSALKSALNVSFGRNHDADSIKEIRKRIVEVNAISKEHDRLTHIDEMKEILRVYLESVNEANNKRI